MSFEGFWVHRGSNDIIFVVTKGADYVIDNFGRFLKQMVAPGIKNIHPYSHDNRPMSIFPNWDHLISVEVQTKKWLQGKCDEFHVKFYFDKETARQAIKGAFKEKNYEKNLSGIASYWSESSISHPNVVFDDDDAELNTIVTDSIVQGLDVLSSYSLPRNKNVYIVTDAYRQQIKNHPSY